MNDEDKEIIRDQRKAMIEQFIKEKTAHYTDDQRKFLVLLILLVNRTAKAGLTISLFIAIAVLMMNLQGYNVLLVPFEHCCGPCWATNNSQWIINRSLWEEPNTASFILLRVEPRNNDASNDNHEHQIKQGVREVEHTHEVTS